jgi:hypothetical protein
MDTTFTVDIKPAEVLRSLGVLKDQQVAYVLVNTLNKTAKLIQAEERRRVAMEFKLRGKAQFILRQAAVITFANVKQGKYEARVRVGQKPGLLLSRFEEGGTRGPTRPGSQSVAVPITGGARPSASADIPESLYVRTLLGPRSVRAQKRTGNYGRSDVFVKPGVGIFQKRGGVPRLLYAFSPEVRLPRKLGFYDTARRVTDHAMGLVFVSETAKAVAHAMGRGQGSQKPTDTVDRTA